MDWRGFGGIWDDFGDGERARGRGHSPITPSARRWRSGSYRTLTVGGFTTNSSTSMVFNLVGAGKNDAINVTGALDISGGGGVALVGSAMLEGYYKVVRVRPH